MGHAAVSNRREGLLDDLGRHVAELVTAGDLEGARVAAEALCALLVEGPERRAAGLVIDLAAERIRRRGGSR